MNQEPFSAEPTLQGLTSFQRNTVEHIIERFYGPDATTRFLVADETGLGKTIVARGVIARAIEELDRDDSVERIDVVYVCSNADLAAQNLGKLNVTGDDHHSFSSRLTLLAKHSRHLRPGSTQRLTKPVNLVSFTPGTSFEKGWRTGKAEERAMLYLLVEGALGLAQNQTRSWAACQLLQGTVSSTQRFADHIRRLRQELKGNLDEAVESAFRQAIGTRENPRSLLGRLDRLLEEVALQGGVPAGLAADAVALVGELRSTLARESVRVIEPDLVILDEFQRFRHLLDESTEAGQLAHHLYDFGAGNEADGTKSRPTARTLLLSATPYKPFTYAEEGEDHHTDFMEVVRWLARWNFDDPSGEISTALKAYRSAAVAGRPVNSERKLLRDRLLRVMVRTERPRMLTETMTSESVERADGVTTDSLLGYVAMKQLAKAVDAPVSVEYWKSAPYFVNFMDGYKIGDRVREALRAPAQRPEVIALLTRTRHLDLDRMARLEPLDPDMGNPRLSRLGEQTLGMGWWKLLWLPPTLQYLTPGGPYQDLEGAPMTKRLVFSSWTATPTAIASLLSYEADRRAAGDDWTGRPLEERITDRKSRRSRLAYRMDALNTERPAAMAHLALFWPMPGLAELGDPLAHRRERGEPLDPDTLMRIVKARLAPPAEPQAGQREASHWFEAFARPDSLPATLGGGALTQQEIVTALAGQQEPEPDDDADVNTSDALLRRHVALALQCRQMAQDRAITDAVLTSVAELAAHSPANIAYRSLRRACDSSAEVTAAGLWKAAAHVASSFRSLFARPETTLLLDQLTTEKVYWRSVLQYCAWGNLQAVMDEYIHHLVVAQGKPNLTDRNLLEIAIAAGEAISLRPARYEVFDPERPELRPTLSAHFALRYGGRRQEQESARQPQVRQAFNSPFRPFVLASTSVGQEGVDFHWWCHSILHWNTPASPIDFEQREGRIDRYDGHAVRLNIVQQHGESILSTDDRNPWEAAYRLAGQAEHPELGAFAPHWVYSGDAKVQRHVAPYALSIDEARLARIKKDVALYRLTFGQPRQEDMLELLKQECSSADPGDLEALRIDLSAPVWDPTGS